MGGAPQLLLRFMQRLDPAHYEPVVWCIRKSSASDLFEQHGFSVIYEPDVIPFLHISDGFYGLRHPHQVLKMAWGQIRSYRAARRVFAQVRPDMIHVNSIVVPGVLCAAARMGCPVVVNVLECVHPGYTGLRGALVRHYTKKWANGFVFMLPSEARRWGLLGTPACVSVFDFIDLTLFTAPPGNDLRTDYHVPLDTALIGYLGRFTSAKGVHVLVQALGELKRKGIQFHALLIGPVPTVLADVGKGWLQRLTRGIPYIERLHALVAAEGLEREVTFTGERLDATRLANQFDVVAVPFIEPHFSRLCAEAAAAGVVAVAFDIDGPGEEIIDGQTGFLARPFDAHDLAAKIEQVLARPAERRTMGDHARRRAAEIFDAEKNVAVVLALYHQLGM